MGTRNLASGTRTYGACPRRNQIRELSGGVGAAFVLDCVGVNATRKSSLSFKACALVAKKLVIFARRALNPLGAAAMRHASLLEYAQLGDEQFAGPSVCPAGVYT
jgi:hypothetical protein